MPQRTEYITKMENQLEKLNLKMTELAAETGVWGAVERKRQLVIWH
jgi:hypothetical protein